MEPYEDEQHPHRVPGCGAGREVRLGHSGPGGLGTAASLPLPGSSPQPLSAEGLDGP